MRDYSRSRAVLLGAWDYSDLESVPAACHSLKRMEALLTGPLCGWPVTRVEVVANADRRGELPDRLMRLFGDVSDVALFYFVGHGQLYDDELCLALAESPGKGSRRKTTGLPFSDVRNALRESDAKTKIVILDCCFSGQATRSGHGLDAAAADVTDMSVGAGEFTMAATTTYRTAWFETSRRVDGPQTYFTKYLIDTIEQGLHGCGDGLPLGAVFSHTADALARDKRPVPTHSVRHHADRFILARNVGGTEGELLPGPEKRRFGRRAILAAGLVVAIAVITLAMVILHTV
ncbi:MAG: caspase family protein [Streptosporangiaceae bacterium]